MYFHVAVSYNDKTAAYAACPVAEGPWKTHYQMIQRNVRDWETEGATVLTVNGPTMRAMMERTQLKMERT